MNLNVGPVYTYFITYGVHMLRKQAVFRASIHEFLRLAELMYGGCFDYRWVAWQSHLFCELCLRSIFNTDRQ